MGVAVSPSIEMTDLNESERARGLAIFTLMDDDSSGTVDIDEICIVHDSDRDAMLKILDNNGDGEVSSEEWLGYLDVKKKEKGKKKFGYFLNYLEQEVPKCAQDPRETRAEGCSYHRGSSRTCGGSSTC